MAAATLKQTIANRLNALLSTGPKTAEGKAQSSQNARTHGLSSIGSRPPADMAAAITERQADWRLDYRPSGAAQQYHFDRLCAESVRLEFCEARISAARLEHAQRADESWDDDRAAAVAQQAATLSRRPEVIQPRLLQSRHGVLWLLDRWDEVDDALNRHDGWTHETWDLALDLLGVSSFAREGSGPWDLDLGDPGHGPGLDLVARTVAALRDRLTAFLDARDDRARTDAALGLDADDPPAIRLLERYAADARRRFSFASNELRRLQALESSAQSQTQAHASAPPPAPPGPRPERAPRRLAPERPADPSPVPPSIAAETNPTAPPPPPLRNEPAAVAPSSPKSGAGALRNALADRPAPLNRRARRALAAAARRS
ncbi:hypothetical protein AB1L88_10425 [Tautonia sp. JC769]|uniref:hypothetical protein n=1 Tax=Tautonia sp. JC769 TaxID=3232135 RepID=UPI003459EEFA